MSVLALGDPGPLVLTFDVDQAVIAILQEWLPTHLRILSTERHQPLPVPKNMNYRSILDQDEFTDRSLPAVLVTTSRTVGTPERQADGTYTCDWDTTINTVVRGTVPLETHQRAALYEGAVRRALGHRASISGTILHVARWTGAQTMPVADVSRQGRYLAAGMSMFTVKTDSAFRDTAGPTAPDAPTYTPTGTVTEVDITVNADTQAITSGG